METGRSVIGSTCDHAASIRATVTADLAIAVRGADGSFHRVETDALSAINTSALEYAACISQNQLELFFTRLAGTDAAIYRSMRGAHNRSRWRRVVLPALRGGRFVIERVTRTPPPPKRRAVRH